jgi:hypothetical protein
MDVVDLTLDGISGYGPFGPSFGNHGSYCRIEPGKKGIRRQGIQSQGMQDKMPRSNQLPGRQHSLELRPRSKPVHESHPEQMKMKRKAAREP